MTSTSVNPLPRSLRQGVRPLAVALLAVVALTGAACSDDSGPEDGDGTSTTTPGGGALWSGPEPNDDEMSEQDAADIDGTVEEVMSLYQGEVPGLWLGVWDSEKGKHLTSWGNAVIDGAEAKPDQIGRIGSLTKTFTAAAMLQQVSEGWVSMDDTIEKLLPDLAKEYPDVAAITVEELLGMTSGIPDYANSDWFLPQVADDPTKAWTAGEIIDQVLSRGDLEPIGTPGYSTTNYLILGQMLEEVVEGDDDISSILTDLAEDTGLTRTAMPEPDDASLPNPHSDGWVNEPGAESFAEVGATVAAGTNVTDWSPSWGGAGGAMYANLEDLGTWAGSGLGTNLLSQEVGDLRISETNDLPEVGTYGLGLQEFGNGWIGHTGQIIGWEALSAYNTDTGDVFVAIVNETSSLSAALGVAVEIYPELAAGML